MSDAELVADFYDASIDPALWPQALSRICRTVNADACALVHRDRGGGGTLAFAVGLEASRRDAYGQRFGREDPWLGDDRRLQPAAVFGGSEVVPIGALVATAFYREWLAPADLLHAAFIVVYLHERLATLIVAYRRSQRPAFQPDELAPLRRLAPRLAGAYRLGLRVARERLGQRAAAAAIDAMPIGVITLNRSGAIVSANPFAQAVLAGGEGAVRTESGLALDRPGARVRLADVIAETEAAMNGDNAAPAALFTVPRYRHRRPLTCLVAVIAAGERAALMANGEDLPAAVIFIGDPDRVVRFEPQRIARLYGLSRAEARVAALVARGQRLEETADNLGIAYETVRKHLKQIFIKTGVSRQAELVRLLVTGPAGLAISAPIVDRDGD